MYLLLVESIHRQEELALLPLSLHVVIPTEYDSILRA
jgi:hypothetical protein